MALWDLAASVTEFTSKQQNARSGEILERSGRGIDQMLGRRDP